MKWRTFVRLAVAVAAVTAAGLRADIADARQVHGIQVGDHNAQHHDFGRAADFAAHEENR